jgi:hypothetical protein
MDTLAGTGTVLDVSSAEADRAWARIGRLAAYGAAIGFIVTTVLYLLDVLDVLDPSPAFVATQAGPLRDEARFWSETFAHQHAIVWDIVARDVIGPLAMLGLIVVGLALRRRVASDRPAPQLMVVFLTVGGILAIVESLLYLGNAEIWRETWGPVQPGWETATVAAGRATAAIDKLTEWPEAFSYLVLALGLLCIASVVRREPGMPRRLAIVCWVAAATLVGFALSIALHADTARSIFALATGVVLAPWVCVWLGRVLGRLDVGAAVNAE